MMVSAVLSVLFSLIPVAVIVAIVLAVRSRSRFSNGSSSDGASTARHVWLYLLTFISLGIFAAGIGQLLALLFDLTIKGSYLAQSGSQAFNLQQLSLGLAMIVIGGPLWFLFWNSIQQKARGNQQEIGAWVRKFFLNLVVLITALTSLTGLVEFLSWVMSGVPAASFSAGNLAVVIVSGVIWYYHWRVSETEGHPSQPAQTLRRWYVYLLSAIGLIWTASGLVQIVHSAVISLPVWSDVPVQSGFWSTASRFSIPQVILGIPVWYFHWFRMAKGDFASVLRQVYFYLLAISGGAIAALTASTVLVFQVLVWIFGAASGIAHFQFLSWVIPVILVGTGIWGYHLRLVREEAAMVEEKKESAQRVYYYLMAFLGLGTSITGFIILIGILLDLIIHAAGTPLVIAPGWWREQLALCMALLIVGLPIWLYYWKGVLKRVRAGSMPEWRALSRRIFLYFVVGASIVALAASSVNVLYQLISSILQTSFGMETLRNSKWSLQGIVVAAPLLWYYWQILRSDQQRGTEEVIAKKNVTLVAGDSSRELVKALSTRLGYPIRFLVRLGDSRESGSGLPPVDVDSLASEIQATSGDSIMLVADRGEIIVIPYQHE